MTQSARRRPTRTCVGCGRRDAQAAMLRVKLGGAGQLSLASAATHGRSAYVHENAACLERLAKTRLLRRSLRADVAGPVRQALVAAVLQRSSTSSPAARSMKPEA